MDKLIESNLIDILRESFGHIYLKDKNGVWLFCNVEQALALGFSSTEEISGKTDFDFFKHDEATKIRSNDIKAMNSSSFWHNEESYTISGTKKVFLSYKTPTKDSLGNITGVFGVSLDITNQKIDSTKMSINYSSSDNMDLLTYITHEIKTPLSCILKMSNLLHDNWEKYPSNEARKAHLKMAVEGNNRLQNVLLNILDLSKIQSGKMSYEKEVYSLKDSVMDVANEFINERSRIHIECSNDNLYGYYDHYRIEQVIRNLIANSVSYGGAGPINLNIEERDDGYMVCNISDEGVGIPHGETETIFDIFNQSSRTKFKKTGSGIGLSICKTIINDHDGKIWAINNSNGIGCTFSFTLPIIDVSSIHTKNLIQSKPAAKDARKTYSNTGQKRPLVLLIDNEQSILDMTSLVLDSIGFDVITADSGELGINILKDNKDKIDLVLLDLIMPDINGLDLLEEIRKNDTIKDVPVCIHSSNINDKNTLERARNLDVKYFVDKTLSSEKMTVLLSEFLNYE